MSRRDRTSVTRSRTDFVRGVATVAGAAGVLCISIGVAAPLPAGTSLALEGVGAGLIAMLLIVSAARRWRGAPRLPDGTCPTGVEYDVTAALSWIPGSRRYTMRVMEGHLLFGEEGGLLASFGGLSSLFRPLRAMYACYGAGVSVSVPDDATETVRGTDVWSVRASGTSVFFQLRTGHWMRVMLLHDHDRERFADELVTLCPHAVERGLADDRAGVAAAGLTPAAR